MTRRISRKHRQELVEELHELGLRATPARIGVLHAIRSFGRPVTHAELTERVRDSGWDAATVYRNLMTLVEAGVVGRTDHGDRRWRFEAVDEEQAHEHPHFFCTDCGTISCLPEVEIRMRRTTASPRAVASRHVEFQLRGVCDDCSPLPQR